MLTVNVCPSDYDFEQWQVQVGNVLLHQKCFLTVKVGNISDLGDSYFSKDWWRKLGGRGCFVLFDTLCKNTRAVWTLLELDKCRCVSIPTATTPPGSSRFKFICASLQHTCRQPLQRSCLRGVRKNKSKCMVTLFNGCLILNAIVGKFGQLL